MTDASETRGWKRDGIRLQKEIDGNQYYIGRSNHTGLYWVWIYAKPAPLVMAELPRLSDAKRAAHKHARERV